MPVVVVVMIVTPMSDADDNLSIRLGQHADSKDAGNKEDQHTRITCHW
jgi:hypothetical protein